MTPVLELIDVNKAFGSKQVLESMGLSVEEGEFVSIIGPSGLGKSTILNIMGLLDSVDSGDVVICGKRNPRIGSRIATNLLRHKISYIFQNFGLVDDATVEYNLSIAARFVKLNRLDKDELMKSALYRVGLTDMFSEKVHHLSGGEQQRIAIAKAMIKQSKIILADEPTGSLDSDNRDIVLGLLKELQEQGKTIVVVTHDETVSQAGDRVITLN